MHDLSVENEATEAAQMLAQLFDPSPKLTVKSEPASDSKSSKVTKKKKKTKELKFQVFIVQACAVKDEHTGDEDADCEHDQIIITTTCAATYVASSIGDGSTTTSANPAIEIYLYHKSRPSHLCVTVFRRVTMPPIQ